VRKPRSKGKLVGCFITKEHWGQGGKKERKGRLIGGGKYACLIGKTPAKDKSNSLFVPGSVSREKKNRETPQKES